MYNINVLKFDIFLKSMNNKTNNSTTRFSISNLNLNYFSLEIRVLLIRLPICMQKLQKRSIYNIDN